MTSTGQLYRLGRDGMHTYWSNALSPRLTIEPGDTVIFECLEDSFGAIARRVAQSPPAGVDPELVAIIVASAYPEHPTDRIASLTYGHPLTGPVAVADAQPGDTLVVEILEIVPGPWGCTGCTPNPQRMGLLNDDLGDLTEPVLHYWDLRNGTDADFKPGIRVPIAPFCGVMGVAPAEPGQHSTVPPSHNGGNMDLRHLTAGTTLYLPVQVPGALFSVGDLQAAQGDGEVTGSAIEIDGTVTLRFGLLKDYPIRQPRLRTSGQPLSIPGPYVATTGHDPDLREAAREALRGMLDFLEREHGLTRAEGYILASAVVDLKISQIVDRPNYTVSAYLPLGIFTSGEPVGDNRAGA